MRDNTVVINDVSYIFEDLSEKAQVSYQQLLSLRSQMSELSMKQQQLAAGKALIILLIVGAAAFGVVLYIQ